MTLHTPLLMQPDTGDSDITYSGAELRAMFSAQYPFEGIIGTGNNPASFAVSQRGAGANLSCDLAAGYALVTGDDVAGQNKYFCWSDATYNLALPAAPGSGSRTHRIGLRIKDKLASGSWTTYEFVPDYVEDTGSGLPSEPASFLTLATASISAGASSYVDADFTDYRPVCGPWRKVMGSTQHEASGIFTGVADIYYFRVKSGASYKITGYLTYKGNGSGSGGLGFRLYTTASTDPASRIGWIGSHYTDGTTYAGAADADYSSGGGSLETSSTIKSAWVYGTFNATSDGTIGLQFRTLTVSTDCQLNGGCWIELERIS